MSNLDINLKRKPRCPRCNREMMLMRSSRDHVFWKCANMGASHPEIFGVVGQRSFFGTARLIDPVTLKIVQRSVTLEIVSRERTARVHADAGKRDPEAREKVSVQERGDSGGGVREPDGGDGAADG